MKKLLSILLVTGIVSFISCGQSKNDQEAKEKAKKDSIAAAKKALKEADSLAAIENKLREADSINKLTEQKRWNSSNAGQIQKLHPDWSKEDCEKLSNSKLWIGMNIAMVAYLYGGYPNHKNVSNYGNGNEYQYCWDRYTPSCFYCKSDDIVYAYN